MKNSIYVIVGLVIALVLTRPWQPPVGRYQLINSGNDIPVKADTATGRIWALHAGGNPTWVEIKWRVDKKQNSRASFEARLL